MDTGSSPLTRGKRGHFPSRDCGLGLIPAHAGKTPEPANPHESTRAHPRSRGENGTRRCSVRVRRGSSPLTRGKLTGACTCVFRWGLIPAHAGKTLERQPPSERTRAHPRSRGENGGVAKKERSGVGSSPLTRGKPERSTCQRSSHGLIPAHAGKTDCERLCHLPCRAHPRSRGENGGGGFLGLIGEGSSPLTRGKPVPKPVVRVHGRLIPAHAGKTFVVCHFCSLPWAHPRSRGENR